MQAIFAIISLIITIKLQMTKIVIAYLAIAISNVAIVLAMSDAGWLAMSIIVPSFISGVGLIIITLINKKVNTVVGKVDDVAKSINGLLEEKVLADKKIGADEEKVRVAKETAIGDTRELELRNKQKLRDEVPPQYKDHPPPQSNSGSDVTEAKDEIIETVKDAIQREVKVEGAKIKETVETKGDEIHEGVNEIPEKVVEIIKTPPPTQ